MSPRARASRGGRAARRPAKPDVPASPRAGAGGEGDGGAAAAARTRLHDLYHDLANHLGGVMMNAAILLDQLPVEERFARARRCAESVRTAAMAMDRVLRAAVDADRKA